MTICISNEDISLQSHVLLHRAIFLSHVYAEQAFVGECKADLPCNNDTDAKRLLVDMLVEYMQRSISCCKYCPSKKRPLYDF